MNKIRTYSQYEELLDEDLAWRKRELTTLRFMISDRRNRRGVALRWAVCSLYAHWEGFVKAAAEGYLSLVASQGLTYMQLQSNLIAVSIRPKLAELIAPKTVTKKHIDFVDDVLMNLDSKAELLWQGAIDTESNLSYRVFERILIILGVNSGPYSLKAKLIDESLVRKRNSIAHGVSEPVEQADYTLLYETVLGLLGQLKDDLLDSAAQRTYVRLA